MDTRAGRRPPTPQQGFYGSNVGVTKPRSQSGTPTNMQQLPPASATLPLDYKTPEQAYRDALDFNGQRDQQQQQQQNQQSGGQRVAGVAADSAVTGALLQNAANQTKIRDMLKRINDSRYMYPAVAVITLSLCVIIMLFQRNVNFAVRCLLVVLLVIFIAYTAYQFRGSITADQAKA